MLVPMALRKYMFLGCSPPPGPLCLLLMYLLCKRFPRLNICSCWSQWVRRSSRQKKKIRVDTRACLVCFICALLPKPISTTMRLECDILCSMFNSTQHMVLVAGKNKTFARLIISWPVKGTESSPAFASLSTRCVVSVSVTQPITDRATF